MKKTLKMFAGLCTNKRDIMVAQHQQRRDSKKIRDNQKRTHAALYLKPPLSPISLEPVEPEILSVEEMATSFQESLSFDQVAGQSFGGSFSYAPPPPPGEGVFGA